MTELSADPKELPVAPTPSAAVSGQLFEQKTAAPTRKVVASTVATAASGIIITAPMVLGLWNWVFPLYPMSVEVAAGIVAIITIVPTLFSFLAGYLRRDRKE